MLDPREIFSLRDFPGHDRDRVGGLTETDKPIDLRVKGGACSGAPKEADLSRGMLESIDMDSYRTEARTTIAIGLADEDKEIEPVPTGGGRKIPEPELDRLSNILRSFNEQFGNIDWKDVDKIRDVIAEEIPAKVAADSAYQNAMKNSDKENARIEHDKALQRAIVELLSDHTELFKQFSDNPSFKRWLGDTIFGATYHQSGAAPPHD